ncbi:Homeobox domain protein [Aphelenchoides besseyi]|nr:Homeobox domain protein [Aphelenchoides besseyi]
MNASSTSTTPGNVGASTASSSSSPFGNDYMNGNNSSLHHQQRPASSSRSNTGSTSGLGNISTITTNQLASSSKNTTSPSSQMQPGTTDHLQRLAQMTDGVGGVKIEETISSNASAIAPAGGLTFDYQNAAAAYYNWTNYQHYQQFNQPMNPNAAFSGWPPSCYTPGQWQNYGQTKKGRQTYQRFQTSVLEAKFQNSSYVSKKQREELRVQTNLTDRQIKIWFQNRRMKAKKEKNRCDEQGDHTTLLPANSTKSLNNSLSSLGTNSNAGNGSGSLGGMLSGQHVGDELIGLVKQEDEQLKALQNMHGHVTPSTMWMSGANVHAVASMGMHDPMQMTWQHILPQNQHQSNPYGMNYSVPYPLSNS